MYCHCDVGGYGPRSSGPDYDRCIGFALYPELHIDGRIDAFLIFNFRIRYCGFTTWTPVDHPFSFFQQVLLLCLLQRPPGSFDILIPQCHIRVFPVKPYPKRIELAGHIIFLQ